MGEFLDKYFELYPKNVFKNEDVDSIFTLLGKYIEDKCLFRGVADKNFGLQSSIERDNWHHGTEPWMISEFKRRQHEYLDNKDLPTNQFELLAMMQHYGASTRLLDVTRSPYVGLYFAVNQYFETNHKSNSKDRALYILNQHNTHTNSMDQLKQNKDFKGVDYHNLNVLGNNPNLFNKVIMNSNQDLAFFLEPYKMNARLNIQQGLFLVTNANPLKSIEQILYNLLKNTKNLGGGDDGSIDKLIIPARFKKEILKQLYSMNISSATLFPGLEGFSRHLKEMNNVLRISDMI